MATNELDKLIQLIDALNASDQQKLVQYLVGRMTTHDAEDMTATQGHAGRLLQVAEQMRYASGQTDISERSREILDTDFGDYLENRMS